MTTHTSRWVLFAFGLVLWACASTTPAPNPYPIDGHDTQGLAPVEVARAPVLTAAVDPPPLDAGTPLSAEAKSLAGFPVFTEPGDLPSLVIARPGKAIAEGSKLPLKETRVRARLGELVAEVEVTQRYENTSSEPIEAVYVFPLPENAAVNRMKMTIGDRVIEAKIEEREAARARYEKAKREGLTAALLEQERPNVFTQSVTNIEPKKSIEVTLRYVQDLSYDSGIYEFVFPMVVGPRFMGGAPLEGQQKGTGTSPDTTKVSDASRISPPYMGKGERSGHDIKLEVVADPMLALSGYQAITHKVGSRTDDNGLVHLVLDDQDRIPNRDFVLRYRVAGEKPRASMMLGAADNGFFSLSIDPPNLAIDDLVGRREIIFVVDISGSMKGTPLALCKEAMRTALGKVRPVDTFNIITFAGSTAKAFEVARPASDANVRLGLDFIDRARAGGGTMLLDAVGAALSPDVEAGRGRYVFFLTDGYVGSEDRIIASTKSFVSSMESKGQRARVFGFGVGSSTNRSLIDGLSREGKGVAVYATTRDDPARGVNQFFRYIDRSVLRDVSIDWGGFKVSDTTPGELPDLFASHPLVIHGRFSGKGSRQPVIHATSANGAIEIPVQVIAAKKGEPRDIAGALWARSRIRGLETDFLSGDTGAQAEITKLGVDFGLVTRFTSFVAVDSSKRVGSGDPTRVVQPAERPEGVDLEAAGGKPTLMTPNRALKEDRDGVQQEDSTGGAKMMPDAPAPTDVADMEVRGKNGGCACKTAGEAGSSRESIGLFVLVGLFVLRRRRS